MKINKSAIIFACLIFLTTHSASAEEAVTIKSDTVTHSKEDNTVRADGNVVIQRDGLTITSEHGSYNRETGVATVQGNVMMQKGSDILRGEYGTLDTNSGSSELYNAITTQSPSNITVKGDTITRDKDGILTLKNAVLTTCDISNPSWKFCSGNLKVDPKGYAVGKDITFHILDTPVLYIPWFAFPAAEENMSGLLFPQTGYSKKRGFKLDLPFYWAISPSHDAVLHVDVETRRGVGIGVDYRYLRKRGSEGEMSGYLIYDRMEDRWRGRFNGTHKEIISSDMNMRASINLTTDRKFRDDFGVENNDYNKQSDDTIINVLKTWENFALTAALRYRKDYYADNNRNTLQTLPEIGISAVRLKVPVLPLYFDLDSSFSHFQRDEGASGRRLYAFSRLTLITGLPGYLNATIYAGAHMRGYDTDRAGSGTSKHTFNVTPEIGATVSASFSRVFDVNGESLKKLRHELTPEVSYRYVTNRDQSRLPFYDYTDQLVYQNVVYYGISSHLSGKFQNEESTEYRDLSTVKIMQGYSMSGERRDLLTMVDDSRHMTDLILESETLLYKRLRLLFDARYDINNNRLSSAAPGLEYRDNYDNRAAIYYRMSRNNAVTGNRVEYLAADLSTKYFNPWTLGFTTRYSFDGSRVLESVYSAEYHHQCWSVRFAFRDRKGNPSFTVDFNLQGLSNIGSTRSSNTL